MYQQGYQEHLQTAQCCAGLFNYTNKDKNFKRVDERKFISSFNIRFINYNVCYWSTGLPTTTKSLF